MSETPHRSGGPTATELVMSMVRSLWGNIYPELRTASIQATETNNTIQVRFEYESGNHARAREACECAATELVSDFWQAHVFDIQHVIVPVGQDLRPLKNLVFKRGE